MFKGAGGAVLAPRWSLSGGGDGVLVGDGGGRLRLLMVLYSEWGGDWYSS